MMVGDPCPMHKHFHTIIGLMDAQDMLLCRVHNGRNHVPWLVHQLTLNPIFLSHCFGEVGRRMDALRFVNGNNPLLLCHISLPPILECLADENEEVRATIQSVFLLSGFCLNNFSLC